MAFRTSPSLGPGLNMVVPAGKAPAWYEAKVHTYASTAPKTTSPQLGDTCMGSDGRLYMWVQASGTITKASSPGTQIIITVGGTDNVTAAAGSGGWYAPPSSIYDADLAAGDRFWAAKGSAP